VVKWSFSPIPYQDIVGSNLASVYIRFFGLGIFVLKIYHLATVLTHPRFVNKSGLLLKMSLPPLFRLLSIGLLLLRQQLVVRLPTKKC
jgi:hypothetical protein